MSLARKLLIPTLGFFVLILIGLSLYFVLSSQQTSRAEEQRRLDSMERALQEELQGYSNLSLALARQVASSPEVQAAFSAGDRERLAELTLPSFEAIKDVYDIAEQQFSLDPATVFLRLSDPQRYGDDLSATRLSLVAANQQQREINGLEITSQGLSMHGITPINVGDLSYNGKACVEVSLQIGQEMLNELKQEYGGEWQFYLRRSAMQTASYPGEMGSRASPANDLVLQSSTLDEPAFSTPDIYQYALLGQIIHSQLEAQGSGYAVASIPLRDFSGQVIGVVDFLLENSSSRQALFNRTLIILLATLAGASIGHGILSQIVHRSLRPVRELTQAAQAISAGNLSRRVDIGTPGTRASSGEPAPGYAHRHLDELGLLASSFNKMADQLEALVGNLETGVAERTADLERRSLQVRVAAEIARDVTALDFSTSFATAPVTAFIDELLHKAVDLIGERFNFYHAGVFLVDENGDYAILRAATGDAGRRMIEAGHHIRVGPLGIVGAACSSGRARMTLDVEKDIHHLKNPMLPETQSEVALPLRIGAEIIGALDVQSRQANAFDEGDVTVLQIMADQLAIAINNARLIQELRRAVHDLEHASGKATWQSWQEFSRRHPQSRGYIYQGSNRQSPAWERSHAEGGNERGAEGGSEIRGSDVHSTEREWATSLDRFPTARYALQRGETFVQADDPADGPYAIDSDARLASAISRLAPDETDNQEQVGTTLAVPVKLRDQVIGVIHMRFAAPRVSPNTIKLVEEFSGRLAQVLESSRLLYEAQRLASREQQINRIVSQVRDSIDVDTILRATVYELGNALGARRTYIQIGDIAAVNTPQDAPASQEATA